MVFARSLVAGLIMCAPLLSAAPAAKPAGPTVLKTVELRTYSEDVTYVGTGPHAKHVAFIEGAKVYGYPSTSQGKGSVKELFDLTGKITDNFMNGLAYMDSEKLYAVVSRKFMDKMMVFDSIGRLESERPIQYPAGYVATWVEGIEYIPQDAPASDYPDHLAMCAGQGDGNAGETTGDILILKRDGSLAKRIPLPAPASECLAVAYQAPGKLLVTGFDPDWRVITILDFDGNVLGQAPGLAPDALEGLVVLPDGTARAAGEGGVIWMLDANLAFVPSGNCTFRETQGMRNTTLGVAWNSAKSGFVLSGSGPNTGAEQTFALYDLPLAFAGVSKLADLAPRPGPTYYMARRLTYLPDESLIAMIHPSVSVDDDAHYNVLPSIQLFNQGDGSHFGEILLPPAVRGRGTVRGVAYLRATSQFAITFNGNLAHNESGKVHILNRDGAYVRTIDFSATITASIAAAAAFPAEDRLLLSDGATVFVGDLNGNVASQFPVSDLSGLGSIYDMTAVATGEFAGSFAAADASGTPTKLVIFTLASSGKK